MPFSSIEYAIICQQCGACGQVGHMRTNKACRLYTGSMGGGNSSPVETDPERTQTDPDEDDLGYVDGVKLTLNTTKIKVRILIYLVNCSSFLQILKIKFSHGFNPQAWLKSCPELQASRS